MEKIELGSILMLESSEAFLVMEVESGIALAEITEEGIKLMGKSPFQSVEAVTEWFSTNKPTIVQVASFEDGLGAYKRHASRVNVNRSNVTIEELLFSVRTYNCLKRSGINFVHELMGLSLDDLMKMRNMGRLNIREIEEKLHIEYK